VTKLSKLRQPWRWCLLSAVVGIFISLHPAAADENGISFWLPGIYGSLAATPQTPGWSLAAVNYCTSVSASGLVAAAHEITVGKLNPTVNVNLNVDLKSKVDLVLLNPYYVFATAVLDGQLAVGITGLVGRNRTSLDGTLTASVGNLVVTSQGTLDSSLTGFRAALEQRRQQLHRISGRGHPSWRL
jgi:hypothetical protein